MVKLYLEAPHNIIAYILETFNISKIINNSYIFNIHKFAPNVFTKTKIFLETLGTQCPRFLV